jgi:hypothetical protein
MKLQFSLATLLVCVTVLAVVCAVSVNADVVETRLVPKTTLVPLTPFTRGVIWPPIEATAKEIHRSPTRADIVWRLAIWGPNSVIATLVLLWSIRRLKSRRANGPLVGYDDSHLTTAKTPTKVIS